MGDVSPDRKKPSSCGLLSAVFRGRGIRTRKSSSSTGPKESHQTSYCSAANSPNVEIHQKQGDRIIHRPSQNYTRPSPINPRHPQQQQQQKQEVSYKSQSRAGYPVAGSQHGSRRKPEPSLGLSGELESMITDYQKSNAARLAHLGNVKHASNGNTPDHFNKPAKDEPMPVNGKYSPNVNSSSEKSKHDTGKNGSLCRALSTRMDPEQLKILGNEDYKNGRFAEAAALYEAAISVDPNKASYRSNKSAALTAMGKLLEAVFECREAIRIDPFYQRAHNRLATLYVRLGDAERAMHHFKQSSQETDLEAMSRAKQVQLHLNKCTEAKKRHDWNVLVKEAELSIEAGADSAPLIFALKAEALLRLNRLQDALQTMENGANFDFDDCTKFFGPIGSAGLFLIYAQVDIIDGRFDDAVAAAQRASRLDPNNRDASTVLRKARGVATARSKGNELFKEGKYSEACSAYEEGLNHDPCNAVLLGNRAACRCKLKQYDKSIEDCSAALNTRPGYTKARLRRADCYAKMGNWEACLCDCELVLKENPENEEAGRLLKEAKNSKMRG